MTQLADSLNVTQRRITALVVALSADGLIYRNPNPADGRSAIISLTPLGVPPVDQHGARAQWPIPQLYFVPRRPSTSRITHNSGLLRNGH